MAASAGCSPSGRERGIEVRLPELGDIRLGERAALIGVVDHLGQVAGAK
jgi:hypothetical protein